MENNKIHEIRLIVAGTRTFEDYALMKEKLDRIILGLQEDYPGAPVVIISGNAKGRIRSASNTLWNENCHSANFRQSGINTGKWQARYAMPR